MSATTVNESVNKTVWIPTSSLDGVKSKMAQLQRRAERNGLAEPSMTITEETKVVDVPLVMDGEEDIRKIPVEKTKVLLTGHFPRKPDYRFLAKIDHTVGEGNVVTTPGAEHEKALNATGVDYHSCASGCDHCGFERKRSNTYIVQHDDGSTLQVGSSCIDDYIGEGTLASVMTAFDIHAFIINTDEFDEMALGVARDTLREQIDIAFYLALAAEQISLTGFVPARGEVPTYILLQNLLNPYNGDRVYVGEQQAIMNAHNLRKPHPKIEQAKVILDWLREQPATNNYMKNLHAITSTGFADINKKPQYAAMLASVPNAYNKAMAQERNNSREQTLNEPFGEVKSRGRLKLTLNGIYDDVMAQFPSRKFAFTDDKGREYRWKASYDSAPDLAIGSTFMLTGTIKLHSEYNGTHYTHLTRCMDIEKTTPDAQVPDFIEGAKAVKKRIQNYEGGIFDDIDVDSFTPHVLINIDWKEGRSRFHVSERIEVNQDDPVNSVKAALIEAVNAQKGKLMLKAIDSGEWPGAAELDNAARRVANLPLEPDIDFSGTVYESEDNPHLSPEKDERRLYRASIALHTDLPDTNDAEDYRAITLSISGDDMKTLALTQNMYESLINDSDFNSRLYNGDYDQLVVVDENNAPVKQSLIKHKASNLAGVADVSNIQSLRKLKIPENSREKIPPLIILSTEQPFKDGPTENVQGVINAAKAANEEGVRTKWKTTSSLTNVIYNVEELEYALYELSTSNSVDDRGLLFMTPDMVALCKQSNINVLSALHLTRQQGNSLYQSVCEKNDIAIDYDLKSFDDPNFASALKQHGIIDKWKESVVDVPRLTNHEVKEVLLYGGFLNDANSPLLTWNGEKHDIVTKELLESVSAQYTNAPIDEVKRDLFDQMEDGDVRFEMALKEVPALAPKPEFEPLKATSPSAAPVAKEVQQNTSYMRYPKR